MLEEPAKSAGKPDSGFDVESVDLSKIEAQADQSESGQGLAAPTVPDMTDMFKFDVNTLQNMMQDFGRKIFENAKQMKALDKAQKTGTNELEKLLKKVDKSKEATKDLKASLKELKSEVQAVKEAE